MPYLLHPDFLDFPSPHEADANGLVAIGGELTTEQLLLAYHNGIFPWYSEGEPICWFSPAPRCVLFPEKIVISKSMQKILREKQFRITYDQCFERVIQACADQPRPRQTGSGWLLPELQEAFTRLHALGYVHSIEAWRGDELVGGLYGMQLGKIFCGESMFSRVPNASKAAFITFTQKFRKEGGVLIDCQQDTPHLRSLGAEVIGREEFLDYLSAYA